VVAHDGLVALRLCSRVYSVMFRHLAQRRLSEARLNPIIHRKVDGHCWKVPQDCGAKTTIHAAYSIMFEGCFNDVCGVVSGTIREMRTEIEGAGEHTKDSLITLLSLDCTLGL
jgi:hypothetical protein